MTLYTGMHSSQHVDYFRLVFKQKLLHNCEISLENWVDYKQNTSPYDFVRVNNRHSERKKTHMVTDTGLSEMLVPMTRTEQFNKSLEIQQSMPHFFSTRDN
jgi:hypothetical protein